MKPKLLFILFLSFISASSYSHPHVFASYRFRFNFSGSYLKSVRVFWEFDVFFSSQIIGQNDRNRNGRFERNEIAAVKSGAFDNLKNYNYFTSVIIDNRGFAVKRISRFLPIIRGRKLIYSFNIPLNIKVTARTKRILITCTDPTIYVAFAPAGNTVSLRRAGRVKVAIKKRGSNYEVSFAK